MYTFESLSLLTGLFLAVIGLCAGFIDAIAGGGGLLTVPALLGVGLPPHLALGTNKFQASFGTLSACWHFRKQGTLKFRRSLFGIFITGLGAMAGTLTLQSLDVPYLERAIPWILLALVIFLFVFPTLGQDQDKNQDKNQVNQDSSGHQNCHPNFHQNFHQNSRLKLLSNSPPKKVLLFLGPLLGFYDGFFGPGTGTFWAFGLVTLGKMDLKRATEHTKLMNLTSNLTSLFFFLLYGKVVFPYALVMVLGQIIGGRLGSGVVLQKGAIWIRPLLMVVAVATALKLLLK